MVPILGYLALANAVCLAQMTVREPSSQAGLAVILIPPPNQVAVKLAKNVGMGKICDFKALIN